MRVTFDTNSLDKIGRRQRFPKDPHQADFIKVNHAVVARTIKGYFSETIVTLEGIENKDRTHVFSSTRLKSQMTEKIDDAIGQETLYINTTTEQDRRPIHLEHFKRIQAACEIGMRALKAPPRIGWIRIDDIDGGFFAPDADAKFTDRMDRTVSACTSIESRGLGFALVKSIADQFAKHDNDPNEMPLRSLGRARDVHEEGRLKRAASEWADADSIAAHIGHGIDLFCTEDQGKGSGSASILDSTNRAWLETTYTVRIISLSELAAMI
jgi:hypothetical protein